MSKSFKTKTRCPNCNSFQNIVLWESVNVTQDPELKEQVINRTINSFVCENCSERGHIDYQLTMRMGNKHVSIP